MLRQIRVLGFSLARVWAWLVVLATSRRTARRAREMRPPLAEELLVVARRTREFLCERAKTVPAERGAEPVPPVPPDPPAPTETRSEGEFEILRFHQIKDVLSPHPDCRTHVECECGWKCDVATREIAWREYDEHVKDEIAAHRPVT